jgi:hypothetical protein
MRILDAIVGAIARLIHPDKPREWFENVELPTDLSEEEVVARLDAIAEHDPALKGWRTSVVDLMKLAHHDAPDRDERASYHRRKELAADIDVSRPYTGSAEDNVWLHEQVFKAIQQRGIRLA